MKTYIVYVNGDEVGYIKAGSHNAAETKAQKKYPPTQDAINSYARVNPIASKDEIVKRLNTRVSVAYTEL